MTFRNILNQNKAKKILSGQLRSGRIAHAYLFLGRDGVGRKKTAIELAKSLNCSSNADRKTELSEGCDHCASCQKIERFNHPDVRLIDFAWQARLENKDVEKQKTIKIDTIRAVQRDVNLKPIEGRWKIYIIDPAEKITLDAANCLLKTLEEPPEWTVIVLLATSRENLPLTVLSRTQIVNFNPLGEDEVAGYLIRTSGAGDSRSREIAKACEGSLSAALAMTDEDDTVITNLLKKLRNGNTDHADILRLSQQLSKDAKEVTNGLLYHIKNDFRDEPRNDPATAEAIIESRRLLERNVNPQMVLDVLFMKINDSSAPRDK
ncbi:MAG: hypothetical protein JW803_05500 [Endomicrobiales bacterium]|nr:hypothetical protein [Endomicrobiales bacterium]